MATAKVNTQLVFRELNERYIKFGPDKEKSRKKRKR